MVTLSKRQAIFTKFINRSNGFPVLAPAFFVEEMVAVPPDETFEPVSNLPFDQCWLIYDSPDPLYGPVTNILMIDHGMAVLFLFVPGQSRYADLVGAFSLTNPREHGPYAPRITRAIRETVAELRAILKKIDGNERASVIPPPLIRTNRRRDHKRLEKIPPYIVIGSQRITPALFPRGGAPKRAHKRRGHWRNLRSGKRIWVTSCSINGGSPVSRDYRC